MTEVGSAERQDIRPDLAQSASDRLSNHGQFAGVSHHDALSLHPVGLVAQPLVLTHLGNRQLVGGSRCEPVQGVNGGPSDNPVAGKTCILLELLDRLVGPGPEDAVDPVGIETELAEPTLEFRYVVASHHRVAVVEEPITEPVVGFDEGVPRLRAADPVNHQAAIALKATQRRLGLGAELLGFPVGAVADQGKPALEIADGVAYITPTQRQAVGRD